MTVRDLLIAARARIADPQRWTQLYLARDCNGQGANPRSHRASSWCAIGAIEAEAQISDDETMYWNAVDALRRACRGSVADVNDASTHDEILNLFDRAIAAQSEVGA